MSVPGFNAVVHRLDDFRCLLGRVGVVLEQHFENIGVMDCLVFGRFRVSRSQGIIEIWLLKYSHMVRNTPSQ